jgi:hypothetical protein
MALTLVTNNSFNINTANNISNNIANTLGEGNMMHTQTAGYSKMVQHTVREATKGGKDKFDTYKLANLLLDLESDLLNAGIDEEQASTICDVACEEVVMKLQTIN